MGIYMNAPHQWTDTDEDAIPDIVEIYFSNVTENNPPIITTLGIETTENWGWGCGAFGFYWVCSVTTKVTIKVFDVAGMNTVKIRLYHWAIIENAQREKFAEHTFYPTGKEWTKVDYFDIDYIRDRQGAFYVEVYTKDVNGFETEQGTKVNGNFGGLMDKMREFVEGLMKALERAWEAVASAVNFIRNWIITEFLNKPIRLAITIGLSVGIETLTYFTHHSKMREIR